MELEALITVSVCIPTRHRPDLLTETIRSCWTQTVLPDEIVIGDDSEDDRTKDLIEILRESSPVPLLYLHNKPPLGQSRNVQRIFETASSTWLLLIHDDDWLLPEAVSALASPLRRGEAVDAVFGKQFLASSAGVIDEASGENLNRTFHRTSQDVGLQPDSLRSIVLGQFPNNGYLVRRALAVGVGYHRDHLRDGCDYAFGVHLAAGGAKLWFVDSFTAVYRRSETSVSRGDTRHYTGAIDRATAVRPFLDTLNPDDVPVRDVIRSDLYRAVVWCGLNRTRRREALRWALSRPWGLRWWRLEGLSALAALVAPDMRENAKWFLGRQHDAS